MRLPTRLVPLSLFYSSLVTEYLDKRFCSRALSALYFICGASRLLFVFSFLALFFTFIFIYLLIYACHEGGLFRASLLVSFFVWDLLPWEGPLVFLGGLCSSHMSPGVFLIGPEVFLVSSSSPSSVLSIVSSSRSGSIFPGSSFWIVFRSWALLAPGAGWHRW